MILPVVATTDTPMTVTTTATIIKPTHIPPCTHTTTLTIDPPPFFILEHQNPKIFSVLCADIRKSPLRSNYTNIKNDLLKLASGLKDDNQSDPSNQCLVGHLCQQFSAYVSARMDLMNCYDSLSTLLRDNGLTIDEAIELISEIQLKNKGAFHHPAMEPLEQSFSYEVEILINLLKCNLKITQLRFIECLFHFKEAQSSLKIWSSESTDGSVLKFHQFTMYFYNLLGEQTTPQEMKIQERPTYFLPSAVMILTDHAETLMEKGQIAFVFDKDQI
uniref:Uncharacterized protein n=1 Tax=Romanomermis culicivorax TaxID=13658 RepID=A0A915J361_ROMCU